MAEALSFPVRRGSLAKFYSNEALTSSN